MRRKWPVALVAALVAFALVMIAVRPSVFGGNEERVVAEPGPGDRVLQSVDLAMRSDGSLATIGDTAVISRAQGGEAETLTAAYDPNEVVDDLPVRVLTSYRTEQRTGTDLADLKGYTGRVRIDLRVENLTVAPQQVSYDVGGRSRTSTAMVGAPLTVVASAALPGTATASVVTDEAGSPDSPRGTDENTNGVLSQSADKTTQVQWASILAPPQLDATATLRLVVDAKDFTLPTFDLSVQPGLVTDPSVGALVDAAFNPQGSSEIELEQRTIKLVGDVNGVLSRASDSITTLRRNLDTTSKTLGTKTVASLKSSTEQVTTSMKTSSDDVRALGEELSSSVASTNSQTLAQLSQTVAELDGLLGDTSAEPPTAKVSGNGCQQTVAAPGSGGNVYADLLQVVAQLDGYAGATQACKEELQNSISALIGPADPRAANACPAPTDDPDAPPAPVTCALAALETGFATLADQFVADGREAIAALDPSGLDPLDESIEALTRQLEAIATQTDALVLPADDELSTPAMLAELAASVARAESAVTALTAEVDQVHTDALDGQTKAQSMLTQNDDLAEQLCALVGDITQPGKLSAVQVEQLRSYLAAESCPDEEGDTVALIPPVKYGAALATRLTGQAATFAKIAAATDTDPDAEEPTQGAGPQLTLLRGQLTDLTTTIKALDANDDALRVKVAALQDDIEVAQTATETLDTNLADYQSDFIAVKAQLDEDLVQVGEDVKDSASLDPQIRSITQQAEANNAELGTMFERSAAGLSTAADGIRKSGSDTIAEQRAALSRTESETTRSLSASSKASLAVVSRDVTSSTRDLDAARVLLARDLNNVILDLGTPTAKGTGVLGALAKSATTAGSADYQLGLASEKGSAFASVRDRDVNGILLRQAQAGAALQRQADLPAFVRTLPPTTEHRTVYLFHLSGGE